jgi:hypothetical protein
MYAIVFAIFLQCFLCTPHPCAVWASSSRAAAPRGSSRSPALPTVRMLHARAPVRAPAARHVPIFPRAVLHGTPVVDPTACQPPGAPDLSATPVGAGSRLGAGVLACPRVHCRHHASVQGCEADVLAYLWETGVRTYGRRPAYLRETGVRTYGRRPAYLRETGCVPTGDAPRTYGRRISPQVFPPQQLLHSRL